MTRSIRPLEAAQPVAQNFKIERGGRMFLFFYLRFSKTVQNGMGL